MKVDEKIQRELSLIVKQVVGEILVQGDLVPRGWLSEQQLPRYCGLSLSFFRKARKRGNGPAFIKVGKRILYKRDAVDNWLEDKNRFS